MCHCHGCQRESGAPATAWLRVDDATMRGESQAVPSIHGTRQFCPRCGVTVLCEGADGARVPLTTLADPDGVRPTIHLAVAQQRPWHKIWDGLPRVEGTELPDPLPTSWRKPPQGGLGRSASITLRPIDDDNRMDVVKLAVAGPQMRFVAPNVLSLLQASYNKAETWLRAIYANDVMVGLCLAEIVDEDEMGLAMKDQPYLWRFMVDEYYQGLGFGRAAIQQFVARMKERGTHTVYVSCVPGTGSPKGFYEALGFEDTGQISEGEMVLALSLA